MCWRHGLSGDPFFAFFLRKAETGLAASKVIQACNARSVVQVHWTHLATLFFTWFPVPQSLCVAVSRCRDTHVPALYVFQWSSRSWPVLSTLYDVHWPAVRVIVSAVPLGACYACLWPSRLLGSDALHPRTVPSMQRQQANPAQWILFSVSQLLLQAW